MNRPITSRRFRESATLIRQEPGGRNEFGEWVPGPETRTDVDVVSAPPDKAEVRDILPEGSRLSEWRMFWIEDQAVEAVHVVGEAAEGDAIEHNGARYTVRHVEDWSPHGFVEVLGVREVDQS